MWDFQGSYTRSTLRSDIGYLDPGTLQTLNFALSRQRPHRDRAVQYQAPVAAAAKLTPKLTRGRIVLHLLGQPADQLLPAARDIVGADRQEDQLVRASGAITDTAKLFTSTRASAPHLVTTGLRFTR